MMDQKKFLAFLYTEKSKKAENHQIKFDGTAYLNDEVLATPLFDTAVMDRDFMLASRGLW